MTVKNSLEGKFGLELEFRQKFEICKSNDAKFDGKIYLAVKSTNIFCLPSCKAKFPFIQNCLFYDTADECISNGFRPCKRCRPDKYPDNYPDWLIQVKNYLDTHILATDEDLKILVKVDITTIRRYFRIHYTESLMSYHRTVKLAHAMKLVETGKKSNEIYEECGYKTIKGFKLAFKKQFGYNPGSGKFEIIS